MYICICILYMYMYMYVYIYRDREYIYIYVIVDICLIKTWSKAFTNIKFIFCWLFFLCIKYIYHIFDSWGSDSLTYSILFDADFLFWRKRHNELWWEVGSLRLAELISGYWAGNLSVLRVTLCSTAQLSPYGKSIWKSYFL